MILVFNLLMEVLLTVSVLLLCISCVFFYALVWTDCWVGASQEGGGGGGAGGGAGGVQGRAGHSGMFNTVFKDKARDKS